MNTIDVLRHGHRAVQDSLYGLPESAWTTPGACGVWSVKDILAHLASFELLLADVIRSVLRESPTPVLSSYLADPKQFNVNEVTRRRELPPHEVWVEYESAHRSTLTLVTQVPIRVRRLNGMLPWYGAATDLEDFIVYSIYGHKREHAAQIAAYRGQWSQVAWRWDGVTP